MIITHSTVTPSATYLAICSRSFSMRIYALSKLDETSTTIEPKLLRTLKPHTAPVVTTAIDETESLLATGSADGSVKVWDLKRGFTTHTFHGHGGVISALKFFQVSGDHRGRAHPKNLRLQNSEESATTGFRLASGSEDGKIRIWDLHKRKGVASLESHVSVVRDISFAPSENTLLSGSRDKTMITWDARTWTIKRIIPVLESIETAGFLSDDGLCYCAGENGCLRIFDHERGSEVTKDQEPASSEEDSIVTVLYNPGQPLIMTVHVDQTLKMHSLDTLSQPDAGAKSDPLAVVRRISGNDDEIIDLACAGPDRSLVALATNTEYIRLVSTSPTVTTEDATEKNSYFGAEAGHLDGHEDIIICLDVDWSGHWIATGAKDNTARLWRIDPATSRYECVATLNGHAESLGAIAFSRTPPSPSTAAFSDPFNHPPQSLYTGSQDKTVKRWDLSKIASALKSGGDVPPVKAVYTRRAHEKDINALDVNHSSTLLASASQDRTAKIWSVDEGATVGVLRGHKRGVWSIRFAPKETPVITSESGSSTNRGIVATGSGDKTVKLWSLSDYSCLLTFEGHTNSILKVLWLAPPKVDIADEEISTRGAVQLQHPFVASAGADGLVKLWSPYTGELETTLDNHIDRVWALATPCAASSARSMQTDKLNYSLVSGGADSVVTFWRDTTSSTLSDAVNTNAVRIEQDQQLQNYIHVGAYREAITLALQLNHPGRLLNLFSSAIGANNASNNAGDAKSVNNNNDSLTGNPDIDTVLQSLDDDNLYLLLCRVRDWNTNARTAPVAQRILYTIAKSYPSSKFIELASRRRAAPPPPPAQDAAAPSKGSRFKGQMAMKDILEALTLYTERHYKRIEELVDESFLIEWILGEMGH